MKILQPYYQGKAASFKILALRFLPFYSGAFLSECLSISGSFSRPQVGTRKWVFSITVLALGTHPPRNPDSP